MARPRNEDAYTSAKARLLTAGLNLIRSASYKAVGINDVLGKTGLPKGSFYHYFSSKKDFGMAIAAHYHTEQIKSARQIFSATDGSGLSRLKTFFETAFDYFESQHFSQGCLMCNLSTELADQDEAFQALLQDHWKALSLEIAGCMARIDKTEIGLAHLSDEEAADWLLNSWSGALTRMKADGNAAPLKLFLKSVFKENS